MDIAGLLALVRSAGCSIELIDGRLKLTGAGAADFRPLVAANRAGIIAALQDEEPELDDEPADEDDEQEQDDEQDNAPVYESVADYLATLPPASRPAPQPSRPMTAYEMDRIAQHKRDQAEGVAMRDDDPLLQPLPPRRDFSPKPTAQQRQDRAAAEAAAAAKAAETEEEQQAAIQARIREHLAKAAERAAKREAERGT